MGTILSFLGGAAFRMMFGWITDFFSKQQEHKHEIERMRQQEVADAARAERLQAAVKAQHEMGVQMIGVQAEANISQINAQAVAQMGVQESIGWSNAVSYAITSKSGIWLVDLWNGVIRPCAATIALVLWVLALNTQGWKMGEWDKELVGMVLGFFFASREMNKKGK